MYRRVRKLLFNYLPLLAKASFVWRLPFLYTALEIRPSSCNILITNRCNLKCIMCRQWQEPCGEELNTETWKRIIDDLWSCGIRNLHFTGGEPLIRKDLVELVWYSHRCGMTVGMTTNAVLLTEATLASLVDAGLRSIALSLDGVGEEYEKIRGVTGSFARVKDALLLVSRARSRDHIDAYINFTLMSCSMKGFESLKQLADEMDVPVHVCLLDKSSSIFDVDANKESFWLSTEEDFMGLDRFLGILRRELENNPRSLILNHSGMEYIRSYFKDPRQPSIPCAVSQDRVYIDPYGNLLSGCLAMGNFGNLVRTSFRGLVSKSDYRKAKKRMFFKKCPGCSCGYMFNIRCLPGLMLKNAFLRISRPAGKPQ